jgi:hypothetical protein
MSIKIRKRETGEVFDLPPDYIIEAEKNNPLFTNKGSQTVSISFQNTNNNRKLLEHSYRLDKSTKPSKTIPVVVESGILQQSGLMAINSASKKMISANIGFDESEMYNRMTKMQLRDIPNLPTLSFNGNTTEEKVSLMLDHLSQVMKQQIDTDYYVFAVILNSEQPDGEFGAKKYFDILNEVSVNLSGDFVELLALEPRQIIRYIDGEEVIIQTPKGYGVSPFIKVWKILELIFAHFGFKVEENPFKDHRQLKKLVVLNNVMDTIMTGTLYYKDLMPDITINQFLDGLFNKFGMLYFLNSNSKTVRLKFLKDILTPIKSVTIDLNRFKTEDPQIVYSSPKQIKLMMNRQLEGCELLANTYEEFLEKYNYEIIDNDQPKANNATNLFDTRRSIYSIISGLQEKFIRSADFFDYDKKNEMGYEEIKMEDLCLPFSSRTPNELMYLFYGVKFKNIYTDLVIGGVKSGEIENPALLAFAFGWGTYNYFAGKYFFASQFNRDPNGKFMYDENGVKYDISLTCNREDGLFNRFWKEYDAYLRHSGYEVKCKLKLTDTEIFNLNMFDTLVLNNQPLFSKQIKYKLNQKDSIAECIFQTLRLYEPYNLEEEQKIPTYHPQKYYWKRSQVDTVNLSGIDMKWLRDHDYTIPDYSYSSIGKYPDTVNIDGQSVPVSQLFLYPPSEEQYINQTDVEFDYTWTAINPSPPFPYSSQIPGTTHVTMRPELL